MEALIERQKHIFEEIKRIHANFKKDSASRKSREYIEKRLKALDNLWAECQQNDGELMKAEQKTHQYYVEGIIGVIQKWYEGTRFDLLSWKAEQKEVPVVVEEPKPPTSSGLLEQLQQTRFDSTQFVSHDGKAEALQQKSDLQRAYFRAFSRLVDSIRVDEITEKWEIDDKLKCLESRWKPIDNLHLHIDGILLGMDAEYYRTFNELETKYEHVKRQLNIKLNASVCQQQSVPKYEIPLFGGNYTVWPTFMDLYSEAIHNNPALTKTQKMQHLKGRLRGEAEKLVQHLHVAPENYDTCWDLLCHRYNNKQLLFTKNFQIFMRQPNVQNQTSYELKRLYDTSMETIHAIHNLNVDTSTWDPMLVHILCEKLDSETYSDYMQSRSNTRELPKFDQFMQFVESKFIALEPLQRKRPENGVSSSQKPMKLQFNASRSYDRNYNSKARHAIREPGHGRHPACNFSLGKITCPLCKNDHALFKCAKFIEMTNREKLHVLTKHNICKNCLYVHNKGFCGSDKRCKECNLPHNTLLHSALSNVERPPMTSSAAPKLPYDKPMQNNYVSNTDDEILLPTTLVQVATVRGEYVTLRALVDQGSQITLITENAAQRLGLQREKLDASVSGVGTLSNKSKGKVHLSCKSVCTDYQFETDALIMTRVVSNLPNASFAVSDTEYFKNITLADPEYNVSRPIDILFDAHVFSEILLCGLIKGHPNQPIAQQTQLGWIMSGHVKTFNCHVITNNSDDFARYWEVEDIQDKPGSMTSQEQYCEEYYIATTTRLPDGRYEVRYPMKSGFESQLGKSKHLASAQFKHLEGKLNKNTQFSDSYKKIMTEYLEMGHMKPSPIDREPTCYLPHHGVLKQDSVTTKLRVVFNASQKTGSGFSLNDLMECGPKLHQDLLTLLIRWRLHKYVFTADCEKMYRMIKVSEEDQQLQKILWRDNREQQIQQYHLCTVTFGVKAAPFLALRTLKQLALDDQDKYPLASDVINHAMYVDDVLCGSNSLEIAKAMQQQLIDMLRGAGLTLRKWTSNNPELLHNISDNELSQTTLHFKSEGTTKALGLQWNPQTDYFAFSNKININCTKLTKRVLLSEISKIFDPLGWLTPVTLRAKLLFQQCWLSECDWDDAVSEDIQTKWRQFCKDIDDIRQVEVPRHLGDTSRPVQLHGFCDASEKAYACIIYLRTLTQDGDSMIRVIAAKSRLAPVNTKLSLPRKELCAAVLLSRLMKTVLRANTWENLSYDIFAWTDSMIVLAWLKRDPNTWKTFVSNRVRQIRDDIPNMQWGHVKSEENAADCATRGLTCTQLLNHSLWWQGPGWLKTFDKSLNKKEHITDTDYELKQKQTCITQLQSSSIVIELIYKHSSMSHVIRIVAWLLRMTHRFTHGGYLTPQELHVAEKFIVKQIQLHEFKDEILKIEHDNCISTRSNIRSLNPFLDNDNILRVGGRLRNANLKEDTKQPMLLPHNHRLTDMLIEQAHLQLLHGGPKLTLAHLRQKYWIVGGYRAVKRVIHKCVTCRRFNAKTQNQIMADLPTPRVTVSRPFTHTGVDFSGHVEIKANKGRGIKTLLAYIAVFVCFATKAVHLELVTELSTAAFLAAFQRFCARRGKPRDMYSDNGTNFVGANRVLRQQYKAILDTIDTPFLDKIGEMGITWHFNAPAWPSAGGIWERAVRSMKFHVKRVIGEQKLTYEEFSTLLCQVEACLNSRPLCNLTESIEDIECLTPGHFLTGTELLTIPEPDDCSIDFRKRWQLVQKLGKDFWDKWSSEYLQQLQARSKWQQSKPDPQLNDIVCIKDEHLPAGKWALGRVIQLHPGRDGHSRVVTLKTAKGELKRPITKLVRLLEIEKPANDEQTYTRKRNRGKNMTWKSLFCYTLLLFIGVLSPSMQQNHSGFTLTSVSNNQSLYFDKVGELQEIKEEWKLIFYYNMTNYWHNIVVLDQYVTHIKDFQRENWVMQFQVLLNQLDQNMKELHYYNSLLTSQHLMQSRVKRGLVNGVGYLANTLFGVLDERFAAKYETDITTVQQNENHLLTLIKNQTSILEAERNIVQRNEQTMIKHLDMIRKHLATLDREYLAKKSKDETSFYVLTSIMAAESILTNLKFMQQTLINTLTNLYQGHIDVHLISPGQLQQELDKIARHLAHNLALPETHDNIKDVYKLLRVHSRITQNYLIMEVKVPLLNDEPYELIKLINIPQRISRTKVLNIIPATNLIAINIHRDTFVPLDQTDIYECQTISQQNMMCKFNHPVYDITRQKSICDTQLINYRDKHESFCRAESTLCSDNWVKLHQLNTWFYYCCGECIVRIICPTALTSQTLRHMGLITLEKGCVLKGNTFMLYANMQYSDKITIETPSLIIPELSPLNKIINTSVNVQNLSVFPETHETQFRKLHSDIQKLKDQSTIEPLTSHDMHHYIMIYVIIGIGVLLLIVTVYCWKVKTGKSGNSRGGKTHCEDAKPSTSEDIYSVVQYDNKKHKIVNKLPSECDRARPSVNTVTFDTSEPR